MTAKFIIVTDMKEPVGVEEEIGTTTIVNVDHIVKIYAVEPHIAEVVGYNSTISLSTGTFIAAKQTLDEITQQL
jgi:hypothetical protein